MSSRNRVLCVAPAMVLAMSCANAKPGGGDSPDAATDAPASTVDAPPACGELCDQDVDGVPDRDDQCPDSPIGADVNTIGCSDSQVNPTLEDTFPPYGLTWTPTGNLGRAGGLTWAYTGITRGDLFHIYWVVCDDPATPCGLSLDGAIDVAAENWAYNAAASDLPQGRLVFSNTTHILLADTTTPMLNGRLTVTITSPTDVAIPFAALATLGVTGRAGTHGAELRAEGFRVVALAEVQDPTTSAWAPYLDYYDAAPTPDTGGGTAATSFGGSFYDE